VCVGGGVPKLELQNLCHGSILACRSWCVPSVVTGGGGEKVYGEAGKNTRIIVPGEGGGEDVLKEDVLGF